MDTTINSNCTKQHKQQRQKNFMDNVNLPEEDISLTRQPLRTALTGFREAKNAFENGTEEVIATMNFYQVIDLNSFSTYIYMYLYVRGVVHVGVYLYSLGTPFTIARVFTDLRMPCVS